MNTPTFKYVEDYIEFIAGRRDINGKLLGIFELVQCPINLARYDVKIIDSLASQTIDSNSPYTDKQSLLAARVVDKYRRQLAGLGVPVTVPEQLDKFRLGIRLIDRSKKAWLEDNKFIIKFPYDLKLIDLIKKQAREGEGSAEFDNDRKVWKLAMTEHMLNWIIAVSSVYEIEVDDHIILLYNKMLEVEKQDYKIELCYVNNELTITNALPSLLDYIDKNLGGLNETNLLNLVDNSSVLGYTVQDSIIQKIKTLHAEYAQLIEKRKVVLSKGNVPDAIQKALDYAKLTNRLPIHVYEQGTPKNNSETVVYLNRNHGPEICPKLLVTTTNLMIGSKKQSWIANAEKIIVIE